MIKGAPFRSLTMPPIYGKSRPASSGDKSGRRFFVEKMTWKSREARLCGIDLRPVPGLIRHYDRFPTADAVGYFLSPFGLDGGIRSKSIVQHHEQNSQRATTGYFPSPFGLDGENNVHR